MDNSILKTSYTLSNKGQEAKQVYTHLSEEEFERF